MTEGVISCFELDRVSGDHSSNECVRLQAPNENSVVRSIDKNVTFNENSIITFEFSSILGGLLVYL